MNLSQLRSRCKPHLWFQLYWVAVSYTHLDVYKRQPRRGYSMHNSGSPPPAPIKKAISCSTPSGAVSYTHLDVYKRQAFI